MKINQGITERLYFQEELKNQDWYPVMICGDDVMIHNVTKKVFQYIPKSLYKDFVK